MFIQNQPKHNQCFSFKTLSTSITTAQLYIKPRSVNKKLSFVVFKPCQLISRHAQEFHSIIEFNYILVCNYVPECLDEPWNQAFSMIELIGVMGPPLETADIVESQCATRCLDTATCVGFMHDGATCSLYDQLPGNDIGAHPERYFWQKTCIPGESCDSEPNPLHGCSY